MKKSILLTALACTVCVGFIAYGAWTALGFNAEHRSFFSRAGGVAFVALYSWIAQYYIARIRRKHST
jgi:hypothetical protein